MTYAEKLRDPRWQKKRLEIMERDKFTCQLCGNNESTLNIHHLYYEKNKDPWDYNNDDLITLCEECHEYETECIKEYSNELLMYLKRGKYFSNQILDIAYFICMLKKVHLLEVQTSALAWASDQEYIQKFIVDEYFKYLDTHRDELTKDWSHKRTWEYLKEKYNGKE
jgi:hypothetical protein